MQKAMFHTSKDLLLPTIILQVVSFSSDVMMCEHFGFSLGIELTRWLIVSKLDPR